MATRPTIVGIGEILWDMFPDGAQFGGAPANFACSVANLGDGQVDSYIVGAVGRDDLGTRALELLRERGVRTDCVAVVDQPTGQVLVHLDSTGQPTYEIATDTAWDNVPWSDELAAIAAKADAVCFGTLGQRSAVSRGAIERFVSATRPECLRILDVNLRPPFLDEETLRRSLRLSNVLKLNDAELPKIGASVGASGSEADVIAALHEDYKLRIVALTRGANGARLSSDDGEVSEVLGEKVTVRNTVGAGDSYTAAMTIGLLRGMQLEAINSWANRVAAYVCTQSGAAPRLPRMVMS
jgi:fructokinase